MLSSAAILIALLGTGQSTPRFERLDNGLRVVVVEDHAVPLVSVQLWYRVGSACDPPGKPGLCAVAREILEQRDGVAPKLQAAGVRFESRTERDACYFSSVVPPNLLAEALDLEAARLRPLNVTAEALARGRNAAADAYAHIADDPNHVAMVRVLAAMLPDHPYQHPPGFVAESLKDVSPDEMTRFLQRWFVPGNATLFVSGDVSEVKALDQVRQRFAGLPRTEAARRPMAPRPTSETIRIEGDRECDPGITTAWCTAPLGYFDNAAIDVLMHRLCNPVDGPLCQRLARIGCEPPRWERRAWRDAGLLTLSIGLPPGVDPERLDGLAALVGEELSKAARTAATEIEHNRARAMALRDMRDRTAALGDRARTLAAYEVIGGDALLADFAIPRIGSVGVAEVQQAAVELLDTRRVVLRTVARSGQVKSTTPEDARRPTPRLPEKSSTPTGVAASHETLTTHELGAGVSISVRRSREHGGLADVRTLVTMAQPPAQSLQVLMDAGSRRHSAEQIRDYLSYHGLDLSPLRHDSRVGLRSRGPTSRVAQMIELQAELLRYPASEQAVELGEIRTVEILVTGDVDAAAAVAAARMAWGHWQASETED